MHLSTSTGQALHFLRTETYQLPCDYHKASSYKLGLTVTPQRLTAASRNDYFANAYVSCLVLPPASWNDPFAKLIYTLLSAV